MAGSRLSPWYYAFDVAGDLLEGLGSTVGGIAQGTGAAIGGALQGAGAALGGALQGAMTRPPVTVINNVGMVGQAGQQKISSGGGVIPPAPKKSAKPIVNASMPTEKLLVIAVNYLASIDKTLQAQLNFDRLAAQEELKTQKEAAIESKPAIGSDLTSTEIERNEEEAKQSSSMAKKLILGTGLFGAALLGIGALNADLEKLNELKANLSAFGEMLEEFAPIMNVLIGAYYGFKATRSPYGAVGGAILGLIYPELIDNLESNFPSVFSADNLTGLVTNPLSTIAGGVRTGYDFLTGNSSTSADATPVNTSTTPNAVPNQTQRPISSSTTGRPEEAMAFFQNNGWTQAQAAGIVGNLAVESGFDPNIFGDGGRAYGIAQWRDDRQANFEREMGTPIRGSSFQQQLQFVNWELNNTHSRAGNLLRGATDAASAAAIVDENYEISDGTALSRRISNANAAAAGDFSAITTSGATGYGGSSASNLLGSATDIAKVGLRAIGSFFRSAGTSLFGNRQYQSMESQTSTAANLIRNMQPPADRSASISDASTRLESIMALGRQEDNTTSMLSALPPGRSSLANVSQTGAVEAVNPNYNGDDSVINYLQYYRLAAAPAAVGAM